MKEQDTPDIEEFKEDFKKIIKAIYVLMPSRNRVSQLIMLLPMREFSPGSVSRTSKRHRILGHA